MRRERDSVLRSLIPSGRTLRNVGVLVAGTAGGQAVLLLASPVLTRLYTPSEFGYLGVFVALLSFLVVIGSLRYEVAVSVAPGDDEAINVLALSLSIALGVSVVAGLLVAGVRGPVLAWLHAEPLARYLWLLPISVAGAAVFQALSYWAIRKERFRPLGGATAARGVLQVVAQLVFGFFHGGVAGLLGGDVIGRVGSVGPLVQLVLRQPRAVLSSVSLGGMAAAARRYRRFPQFSAVAALLSTASLQIPALLFVALYDARVAGWVALAQRVVGAPVTLLGRSVSQVYVGQAAKILREDSGRLRGLLLATVARLVALAALPAVALALVGPGLFALLFGESWRTSGHFVRLLAPMFLVQFGVFPVSETLNLLERQGTHLIWDGVRLVLLAGAFWLAKARAWPAVEAVAAYAVVMLVSYLLLFALSWRAAGRVSLSGEPTHGAG